MARTPRKHKKTHEGEFDPTSWAHAVFALGAFMGMWVFSHLVEDVWAWAWSVWPQHVPRPQELMANGIGATLGIVGGIVAWRIDRYFKFICEVAIEVSQIIWPTRTETKAATIVVIVLTLICAVLLFSMDFTWRAATNALYELEV